MSHRRQISVVVNGSRHESEVEARKYLAEFLREDLGLVGTHIGCEHGVCGACTVLMEGVSVRSCLVLAVQANEAEILTVEGRRGAGGDVEQPLPLHRVPIHRGGGPRRGRADA